MIKLFASAAAMAGLAVGTVMLVDGPPAKIVLAASPADSFVVHDAPPVPTPTSAPTPAPGVAASDLPAPAPSPAATDSLDAAIERLRAAAPKPVDATPPPTAPVTPSVSPGDALLAGPNPAPSILLPPQSWPIVTSQGVRWRGAPGPALVIDMGGGRTATVQVDPAFQALPREAANSRVDFLKQTILETFPPGARQFRFDRDGNLSSLR